jgi:hypothetical protein
MKILERYTGDPVYVLPIDRETFTDLVAVLNEIGNMELLDCGSDLRIKGPKGLAYFTWQRVPATGVGR